MKQGLKIVYMADRASLIDRLHCMIGAGYVIQAVTPLRPFEEPNIDGVAVTDWLIIYAIEEE